MDIIKTELETYQKHNTAMQQQEVANLKADLRTEQAEVKKLKIIATNQEVHTRKL